MSQKISSIDKAKLNLRALSANPYPGRGLIVGLSGDGKNLVQVYWIMGRSDNSRNRIFVAEGCDLRTAPADVSKVKDPSLIIYRAMAENTGLYIVSNGDQTDTVVVRDTNGSAYRTAFLVREYEPDAPNFTPRITAVFSKRKYGKPSAEISVLKKSEFGDGCDRFLYRYDAFQSGIGHCVTTYSGDGNPLPSFCGEPYLLPLSGDIDDVAASIWSALNEENRVSLAVKFIDAGEENRSTIRIINKYSVVI